MICGTAAALTSESYLSTYTSMMPVDRRTTKTFRLVHQGRDTFFHLCIRKKCMKCSKTLSPTSLYNCRKGQLDFEPKIVSAFSFLRNEGSQSKRQALCVFDRTDPQEDGPADSWMGI